MRLVLGRTVFSPLDTVCTVKNPLECKRYKIAAPYQAKLNVTTTVRKEFKIWKTLANDE